jgi:DNA-binding CsgD family transcriptional regulator
METLALNDTQKLHHSIQKLYTLHDFEDFGVQAIKVIDQLVPSEIPSFLLVNLQTQQIQDTFLPDFPGLTSETEQARIIFFNEHPVIQRLPQTLDGAYKISDFIDQKELESSEGIYQRYLRTLGIVDHMCMSIRASNTLPSSVSNMPVPAVALYRSKFNFTERDRLILNFLRPHLFQAYCNAQQYQHLAQELNQLQQSLHHLGVVIIDMEGQIQSIAPQAAIWLETYFSKPTSSLKLPDHLWSWVKHQITMLTQIKDLPLACLPLHIEQAGRELIIRLVIEPLGTRYLLLLEEQTCSCLQSLALLGLSQRETEVLSWVMQGKDNKTIASHLNIHISTVRKHLENIYLKWDVQSRTEAIAQALEKLGLLNSLTLN